MKKTLKITVNAPVVICFVAICVVALAASIATGGATNKTFFMTYHSPLKSPLTYLRFFTHIFGHANLEHLVGNMCYILLLGPLLEEKYSSKMLIQVIVVTALITGVVNYVLFPHTALCGASGVVFAFILLSSFTSFKEGEIPLTFIMVAVFFIGNQVLQGIFAKDNISQFSHIIGGIVGSLAGYALNIKTKRR